MMKILKNNKAFTLAEVLVALVTAVLLTGSVLGVFISAKYFYTANILGQNLQASANGALAKIIKGGPEPGGNFRLSEAVSYTQPSISELHFTGTDGIERWIKMGVNGRSIIYHHPSSAGTRDEVVYAAPSNATLTLRFWTPAGTNYTGVDICVDLAIVQSVRGKPVSGFATAMVNIRNHAT